MKLLWLELRKLAHKTIRLVAFIFLIAAVLSTSLGESMIVSAPLKSGAAPAQMLHLQLFGGLIHVHPDLSHHKSLNHTGVTLPKSSSGMRGVTLGSSDESLLASFATPKLLSTDDSLSFKTEPTGQVVLTDQLYQPGPFHPVPHPPPWL